MLFITLAAFCYELKLYRVAVFTCGGFITGVLFTLSYVLDVARKLKAYKRELEKSSVSSDENNSKVKVLEAKIEVLEKALKDALSK